MDWAYLASLFDHKGNLNLIKVKGKEYIQLRFYSKKLEVVGAIQEFLECGSIYMKELSKKNKKWSDSFELTITSKQEIFLILNQMLPYLIIKQDFVKDTLVNHPLFEDKQILTPQKELNRVYIG